MKSFIVAFALAAFALAAPADLSEQQRKLF
jgi:hypothetical protein